MKNIIVVKYLTDGRIILKLKEHLKVCIEYLEEDNVWEIDERELSSGIYVSARTAGEAYADYEEYFIFLWETYVFEDNDKLTKDAQELKYWLRDVVEGVRCVNIK